MLSNTTMNEFIGNCRSIIHITSSYIRKLKSLNQLHNNVEYFDIFNYYDGVNDIKFKSVVAATLEEKTELFK